MQASNEDNDQQSGPTEVIRADLSGRFLRASDRGFEGLDWLNQGQWQGPFFFLQLADPQFGFFRENASWEEEVVLAEKAVQHINAMQPRPRFVIVCGDLIHAFPWETQFYANQVSDFKRIFAGIDESIPLVCLCGNHDVGNSPSPATIAQWKRQFGDDYFKFWIGGVCGLVINASLISDPSNAPDAYQEQQAWFLQQLKNHSTTTTNETEKNEQNENYEKNDENSNEQEKGEHKTLENNERQVPVHLLVFQHQPWFLQTADEPNQYFNIKKERRMPMLEAMREAGVRAIFAGHYHRNSYGRMGAMEMITTSALGRPLGNDPSGFRIVKVFRNSIEHKYYGLDEMPLEVELVPMTKHACGQVETFHESQTEA
jgi:hypothetical protein